MKKIVSILVSIVLVACSSPFVEGELTEINQTEESFSGVIERPDGGRVSVSLTEEEDWGVGDQVRVYHEGTIMESDPAQINQLSIEKIE